MTFNSVHRESSESSAQLDVGRPQLLTKYATGALLIASIICILLGVYFRCDALDRKYLWYDEILAQMWISSHLHPLSAEKLYTRKEVLDSIRLDDTSSIPNLVTTLWKHNQEQAPIYFIGDYLVCRMVGDNALTNIRIFSIFCGILVIPVSYLFASSWLGSKLAGLVTAGIIAISPFCLEMSLQAKPYGLWAVLCLTTAMMLSKALHKPSLRHWVMYGITLLICLYTHVWSVLFLAALGLVVFVRKNMRPPIGFVVSSAVALLLFCPWISGGYPSQTLDWLRRSGTVKEYLLQVAKMLVACFCEFCQDPFNLLASLVVIAIAISVGIFVKTGGRERTLPLMLFMAGYMAAMIMLDLFSHRSFAASNRYLTPVLLALWVTVGGANLVWSRSCASWEKLLVFVSTFTIFGVGTFSSAAFSTTKTLGNELELPKMMQVQHDTVIFVTGRGITDAQNTLYKLAYRPLDDSTRFVGIDINDKNSHIPIEDFDDSYIYDALSNKIMHYHRDNLISQCAISAK